MAEREESGEEGAESGLSEQQQAAMQQEEKVLTMQIENLQKEKLVNTFCVMIIVYFFLSGFLMFIITSF